MLGEDEDVENVFNYFIAQKYLEVTKVLQANGTIGVITFALDSPNSGSCVPITKTN